MQELRVHGSIFFLFKKFVVHHLSLDWESLNGKAGTDGNLFCVTENYPIESMARLMDVAASAVGSTRHATMEEFGRYLVNDLFALYKDYIRPEWTTFDVLLHTETVMHGAVRKLNSTANPPILNVSQVNPKLLIIDYYSRRRFAPLALGIIKGIADYYGESGNLKITPVTDPDDERVQIRLDFV